MRLYFDVVNVLKEASRFLLDRGRLGVRHMACRWKRDPPCWSRGRSPSHALVLTPCGIWHSGSSRTVQLTLPTGSACRRSYGLVAAPVREPIPDSSWGRRSPSGRKYRPRWDRQCTSRVRRPGVFFAIGTGRVRGTSARTAHQARSSSSTFRGQTANVSGSCWRAGFVSPMPCSPRPAVCGDLFCPFHMGRG